MSHRLHSFYRITVAAVAASVLSYGSALAENLFLLQVGVFSSQENASQQLTDVRQKHGTKLGEKRYILRKTMPLSGGDSSWRVLVGPFDSRKQASHNCADLKSQGTDCFVVETAAVSPSVFFDDEDIPNDSDTIVVSSESQNEGSLGDGVDSLLPWNWLGDDDSTSQAVALKADEEDRKQPVETTQESSNSKNININTHSVYEEKAAAPHQVSLADSLGDLFNFSSDASETENDEIVQDVEIEPTPVETATLPVESQDVASIEPEETIASNSEVDEVVEAAKTEKTDNSALQPDSRTGEIEVAEAIPVPLMEPGDVPVFDAPEVSKPALLDVQIPKQPEPTTPPVANAPKPEIQSTKVPETPTSSKPDQTQAKIEAPKPAARSSSFYSQAPSRRLLQLSVFENENRAFQCINVIQSNVPAAGLLRTRLIKSTEGKAIVRLGPVNDLDVETSICSAANRCGQNLKCRIFSEQIPASRRPSSRSVSSSQAPKDLSPRSTNTENSGATKSASLANQPVWIQLGTSNSKSDAESRFKSLQVQFPDLLANHKLTISSPNRPSLAGEIHRLRIGPFDRRTDAQNLCAKLSSRGAGCLILTK